MMKSCVKTIDPDEAAKMLEADGATDLQRPVRQSHVDWMARQMQEGKWKLNGEPLILCNSKILDGQHRLWACVSAGKPFETLVVTTDDPDVFETIDTGRSRSAADVLHIEFKEKFPMKATTRSAIASAVPIILSVNPKTGGITQHLFSGKVKRTNQEIANYVNRNRKIIDEAVELGDMGKWLAPLSHVIALYHLVLPGFPDAKERFFGPFQSGAGLAEDSPVLLLRMKALRIPRPLDYTFARDKLAVLIKAWNATATGQRVRSLRYASSLESFPAITLKPAESRRRGWHKE